MNWFASMIRPSEQERVFVATNMPTADELVNLGTAALVSAEVKVTGDEFRRLMVRVEMLVPSPSEEPEQYLRFWRSTFPTMARELIAQRTT